MDFWTWADQHTVALVLIVLFVMMGLEGVARGIGDRRK